MRFLVLAMLLTLALPQAACAQTPLPQDTSAYGVSDLDEHADDRQCVDYARSVVPTLPWGLITLRDKLRIINSNSPAPGEVAIITSSNPAYADIGHVAVVEEVTANSITISEANHYPGFFDRRRSVGHDLTEAANALHIVGYFKP